MKVNVVASVNIWEKITRSLRTLRLDTMRGKFVAFAVLATLFTTLVMTLMLYGRNRRSLSDRIGQELRGASSDVAIAQRASIPSIQHQRHDERREQRRQHGERDKLAPHGVEAQRPQRASDFFPDVHGGNNIHFHGADDNRWQA